MAEQPKEILVFDDANIKRDLLTKINEGATTIKVITLGTQKNKVTSSFETLCVVSANDKNVISIVDADDRCYSMQDSSFESLIEAMSNRLQQCVKNSIQKNNVVIVLDQSFYDFIKRNEQESSTVSSGSGWVCVLM